MRCLWFRERVHEFLDGTLPARDMTRMNAHLDACSACRGLHHEYLLIRSAISGRARMPEASADLILARIRGNGGLSLEALREWTDRIGTSLRDFDRRMIWARVTAMPLTVCLFALLMIQFVPSKVESLAFLVVSVAPSRGAELSMHTVSSVQARQSKRDLNGLMDTAWRLPYEDSLSLVAEIGPAGHAEIGSILEYPKSGDLLDAVHLSLQRSRFEWAAERGHSLLIYSFQKIDVYDRVLGL